MNTLLVILAYSICYQAPDKKAQATGRKLNAGTSVTALSLHEYNGATWARLRESEFVCISDAGGKYADIVPTQPPAPAGVGVLERIAAALEKLAK